MVGCRRTYFLLVPPTALAQRLATHPTLSLHIAISILIVVQYCATDAVTIVTHVMVGFREPLELFGEEAFLQQRWREGSGG